MRASLSLFFLVLLSFAAADPCPPNYDLMEGNRCIRALWLFDHGTLDWTMPRARAACSNDGATLPIIKDEEENAAFNRIAESFQNIAGLDIRLVLDLRCNTSNRIEWADGSPVDYTPAPGINTSFDCSSKTMVSEPTSNDWSVISMFEVQYFSLLCVAEPTAGPPVTLVSTTAVPTGQCENYSLMDSPLNGSCFKLFVHPLSWEDAQIVCDAGFGSLTTINSVEENRWLWRTAISNYVLDGMHIGAHQSSANPNVWTWVDGEVPIKGEAYDNFISAFPIPGAGFCGAMMTENTAAQWINEDCNINRLPFICRRDDFSSLPQTCPNSVPAAGENFYPPGFPWSDTPCEYVLFVAVGKLVEIEIIRLVAKESEDYLEILEGSAGPNVLANLTGSIHTSTKFKTAQSNVMRVNWKPNGPGGERGFKVRYNEVDA